MCIKQKIFNEKETNDLIMLLERKLDLIEHIINEEIKLDIIGGLLLSKLLLYKLGYVDDNLLNEISILIKQVGFGTNHSICHGDMGSLSILYYAASILKDSELKCDGDKTLNSFNEDYGKMFGKVYWIFGYPHLDGS